MALAQFETRFMRDGGEGGHFTKGWLFEPAWVLMMQQFPFQPVQLIL